MKIRDKVFGSGSERELFIALHSMWSEHFNLWPALPFLSVIEVGGGEVIEGEWQHLLKTSLDITLCTKKEDRPAVSIEFDGDGHGFSRDGNYIQMHPSKDPHRKLKMDLKLRIAERVCYPLFVLSYDEKNFLGPNLKLTIADGLIGQVLAQKHMLELLRDNLSQDLIEHIHPNQNDYIQDRTISAGVAAELAWNPIAKLASGYEFIVEKRLGIADVRYEILHDPQLPTLKGHWSDSEFLESMEAYARASKEVVRIGCRITVATSKGQVRETVWVRNISGYGVHPMGLARDIAKIIVYKQIAKALGLSEGISSG